MSSRATAKPSRPGAPSRPKAGSAASADDFLGGRISVLQPRDGHRAGSDAVFLAAAVPARAGERVLDAGAGVGVAGLCLAARVPGVAVTAVEIDAKLCALAEQNAARNGFAESFEVVKADVSSPASKLRAAGLMREGYQHVIANPPFHSEGAVRKTPDEGKATAHVMRAGGLGGWIRFLATMAAPKGRITLIHRPESLGELLQHLEGRFGDIAVFPLFPKSGEPAVRIIVQGRKGSRAGIKLLPGLVLHEADGRYTDAAEAVLRGGEALVLFR
jgi:tRNA1(Val) A37 N6-methylase TrmN6